jgi:hypothetical protein
MCKQGKAGNIRECRVENYGLGPFSADRYSALDEEAE